jgi:hypothetical protein
MPAPTRAPTADELLADPAVQDALAAAWRDSLAADAANRHEEGGWVYLDLSSGAISIRRAKPGAQDTINLFALPVVAGSTVVATFHTHPNPAAEGWSTGPSEFDEASGAMSGVPALIRAEDGDHWTGPVSRVGGLANGRGFPP